MLKTGSEGNVESVLMVLIIGATVTLESKWSEKASANKIAGVW